MPQHRRRCPKCQRFRCPARSAGHRTWSYTRDPSRLLENAVTASLLSVGSVAPEDQRCPARSKLSGPGTNVPHHGSLYTPNTYIGIFHHIEMGENIGYTEYWVYITVKCSLSVVFVYGWLRSNIVYNRVSRFALYTQLYTHIPTFSHYVNPYPACVSGIDWRCSY